MPANKLPLWEASISDLFFSANHMVYEVPIYQRNYAWGMDEISALVQDVFDAYCAGKESYFIGTLVTFHKGKRVYEVIDGQQRLTTVYLMLEALGKKPSNALTYTSRPRSTETIQALSKLNEDGVVHVDEGISAGFAFAEKAINDVVSEDRRPAFRDYFLNRVHIIFYEVPKDVDLNHYFEVMNSRGEQLERHEVVKAALLGRLGDKRDRAKFNQIWERCSEMDVYIQQRYSGASAAAVFGSAWNGFAPASFDELPDADGEGDCGAKTILELVDGLGGEDVQEAKGRPGARFQPIIDFPNFLLIVLKLTRMGDAGYDPGGFALDDKEIIRAFDAALSAQAALGRTEADFVKEFGYNLLLCRFFLDNYVVHHVLEDDQPGDNPWKLQRWELHESGRRSQAYPVNLFGDEQAQGQDKCEQLLSMFEVAFTARQRKNYLLYCLLHLHAHKDDPCAGYPEFLEGLAKAYLWSVYLGPDAGLNERNTPTPGAFDAAILEVVPGPGGGAYRMRDLAAVDYGPGDVQFARARERFGDGSKESRGIPLFVFNYLDYLLWDAYCEHARGRKPADSERQAFFTRLGCSDFGLEAFDDFYFSRTRRSLEHYYPQAMQARRAESGEQGPTVEQINCLGNYAMIGHEINSSGSNWSPIVKLDHYLDKASGKISRVSVASLKFMVMMQMCKDNAASGRASGEEWVYQDIARHQRVMVDVLLGRMV